MQKLTTIMPTSAMIVDVGGKQSNIEYYNLAAGDPNCSVSEIIDTSYRKLDIQSCHNYGDFRGELVLRKLINPSNPEYVCISNGAKQMIYMCLNAITDPGDEVVIIGPCWSSYIKICELLHINYKLLVGTEENHYIPDINVIKSNISINTCAVMINNPNNPTGIVYDEQYLDALINICKQNNCWLISDEIYKFFCYEGNFISLREREDNIIVIDGFSKSHNITGWRLGYCEGPKEVVDCIATLQSQMSGPPNILIQNIIINSYKYLKPTPYLVYKDRRDLLCTVNEKFTKFCPHGGFYFYLPIDNKWTSTQQLCDYLRTKFNILVTPGDEYGVPRTIRLSFASISRDKIYDILEPLKEI